MSTPGLGGQPSAPQNNPFENVSGFGSPKPAEKEGVSGFGSPQQSISKESPKSKVTDAVAQPKKDIADAAQKQKNAESKIKASETAAKSGMAEGEIASDLSGKNISVSQTPVGAKEIPLTEAAFSTSIQAKKLEDEDAVLTGSVEIEGQPSVSSDEIYANQLKEIEISLKSKINTLPLALHEFVSFQLGINEFVKNHHRLPVTDREWADAKNFDLGKNFGEFQAFSKEIESRAANGELIYLAIPVLDASGKITSKDELFLLTPDNLPTGEIGPEHIVRWGFDSKKILESFYGESVPLSAIEISDQLISSKFDQISKDNEVLPERLVDLIQREMIRNILAKHFGSSQPINEGTLNEAVNSFKSGHSLSSEESELTTLDRFLSDESARAEFFTTFSNHLINQMLEIIVPDYSKETFSLALLETAKKTLAAWPKLASAPDELSIITKIAGNPDLSQRFAEKMQEVLINEILAKGLSVAQENVPQSLILAGRKALEQFPKTSEKTTSFAVLHDIVSQPILCQRFADIAQKEANKNAKK